MLVNYRRCNEKPERKTICYCHQNILKQILFNVLCSQPALFKNSEDVYIINNYINTDRFRYLATCATCHVSTHSARAEHGQGDYVASLNK